MRTCCTPTSVLFPLIYAICAQTVFLPAKSPSNESLAAAVPITNVSRNLPAINVGPISLSSRDILLAFIAFGQPIPEDEVKDTLMEADQAIFEHARAHPTQRILNDRFEYRRLNGDMLISITTIAGQEITWMELNRVLQGLYRYMTAGPGTTKTHYQALEFEIEAKGQQEPQIGYGLVWYFNPVESKAQKRATLPPTMSLVNEGTLRSQNSTFPQPPDGILLQPANTTAALPGAGNVRENQIFHIPKTILDLSFYFFGPPIPAQSVQATLTQAMAKVRPHLNGAEETDPITDDCFRLVFPLSPGPGIPIAVTVFTYPRQVITWRHLFDVLFGLYTFTSTFGSDLEETHYQVLGFRILDNSLRRLGVGSISFFRSESSQLAKRLDSVDAGPLLQRPSLPNNRSLNLVTVSASIVYPLVNTNINLTFTFLGATSIPFSEIEDTLKGAREDIHYIVARTPDNSIGGMFRDASTSGHVLINVLAYGGKIIKWKELDTVLGGVLQFCRDDRNHQRVLVFEIDVDAPNRGRVGFGTLLYITPDSTDVEKRNLAVNVASK